MIAASLPADSSDDGPGSRHRLASKGNSGAIVDDSLTHCRDMTPIRPPIYVAFQFLPMVAHLTSGKASDLTPATTSTGLLKNRILAAN